MIIDKNDPKFNQLIYKNYWDAYISYTKLLCKYNHKGNNLCVIADYMNRPAKSDKYLELEINTLPEVFNSIRAHSETFILLQIVDLLLGSAVFQWRQKNGYIKDSNCARAKIEFVKHIISKLVIPSEEETGFPLAQHITINKPFYFNVWPLRLAETK